MGNGFWLISERIEIFSIRFVINVWLTTKIKNIIYFFENFVFSCSKLEFQKFQRRFDLAKDCERFKTE